MSSEKYDDSKLIKTYKEVGPYLGLGTQLAATVVIMFFLGKWLDSEFDTFPVLIIICTFFGAAAGLYNFIATALSLNKKKKDKNDH